MSDFVRPINELPPMLKDRQTEHKTTDEDANTHSGTFGCPNARATASQPKEPEFLPPLDNKV